MIAVLIGIIVLIVVIATIVGIGFLFGVVCGIYFTVDQIMDDPYLRVAALRTIDDTDNFYLAKHMLHGIIKDRVNEKL